MPSAKKTSSASKRSTNAAKKNSKRSVSKKKTVKKQLSPEDLKLRNDILLILSIVVAVVLFLSNFGLCGSIGKALSGFFFGLFGFIEYFIPFILFFGCAFFIANADNSHIKIKAVGFIGCFIATTSFFQILMVGYEESANIISYYNDSAADHLGGGLLGGAIITLLGKALGTIGTYIVVIAAMVIFAILVTQRPLVSEATVMSKAAYDTAKNTRRKAADKIAEAKEERKKRAKEEISENVPDAKAEDAEPSFLERSFPVSSIDDTDSKEDNEISFASSDINTEESDNTISSVTEAEPKKRVRKRSIASKVETEESAKAVAEEIKTTENTETKAYRFPPLSLLSHGKSGNGSSLSTQVRATALKLQETLNNFGVKATVINVSSGPTVTRYELQPELGVKVSKIVNLADDIKLNLAAEDIRIEAPIPGKAAVGIEVPNKTNTAVMLGDLLRSEEFKSFNSKLAFAVGKDLAGKTIVADISKMPHLLIAGATGSGKSVCINTLILSILYKASPDEVKFIMVDPKVVELSVYNNIPHLLIPVVTDPKKASGALNWAVAEMTNRYNAFAEYGVRDIKGYNEKVARIANTANDEEEPPKKMPQIVIIIDELADLMMVAPGEVEDAIVRLTQLARAAGIHLIVATQRPSVNVITGLIKANMPSRIALSVASGIDSRVIIDMNGAEKLLGKGDMLFYPQGYQKPSRVQGAFVSDGEIESIVRFLVENKGEESYDSSIQESIDSSVPSISSAGNKTESDRDVYFVEAGKFIIEKDKASIGMLQRIFKIGFNRAARIMDQLCEAGVVGEEEGTKPRKILMSMEQFENYLEEN